MDSDLQQQPFHHHFQGIQRQFQLPTQQMSTGGGGGGLTRFRSAPSSYFSTLMDPATAAGAREVPQPRPLSPETESFLAQFLQSVTDAGEGALGTDSPATAQPDFAVTVKQEEIDQQIPDLSSSRSSSVSCNQMSYHSSSKPPLAKRSSNSFMRGSRCGLESNFKVPSMNNLPSMKMETGFGGGRNASTLSRFKSSPAGLFDDIIIENGYLVTTPPGSNIKSINNDEMNMSTNQGQIANSTGMSSANTDIGGDLGITAGGGNFISSFPVGTWDESSMFPSQFPKPEIDVGELNPSENQEKAGAVGNRPWGMLAHHLSLPKASLEKLMQLQDSVPCQMRAKRGCATHPRSIAERVRRTKISERMRKLQDLVPNMDKQTNTSDMLDLAADYIKDLQRQLQTLANKRGRCTCST